MPDLIDDGTWREASLDRMSEVFPPTGAFCSASTPPDAFTVTDRRFTSNADRRIVAERRREFFEPGS